MDEICLEMRQITRWERGQRLILDHVDFSVQQEGKSSDQRGYPGRYAGDVRGGFGNHNGAGRNMQNILCRDHTGTISGSGTDESNGLSYYSRSLPWDMTENGRGNG